MDHPILIEMKQLSPVQIVLNHTHLPHPVLIEKQALESPTDRT